MPEIDSSVVSLAPGTRHSEYLYKQNPDQEIEAIQRNRFTDAGGKNKLDRFFLGVSFSGDSFVDWGWVQHMHASLNATDPFDFVLANCSMSSHRSAGWIFPAKTLELSLVKAETHDQQQTISSLGRKQEKATASSFAILER